MSHIRTDTTKIQNPNVTVLKRVVESIAKTREGGRLANAADSYYGGSATPSNIGLAIFTNQVRRGMAINVDKSKGLSFVGDGYGYEKPYRQLQHDITNGYLDDEIEHAMRQASYSVSRKTEADKVTFVGDSVDGTKVTIVRNADGRLDWNFEGFAGNQCFEVQKLIADVLKARGIQVTEESVTTKDRTDWLEERLPDRERERN